MAGHKKYDWDRLFEQAKALVEAGTDPTVAELSTALAVPQSTLRNGFRREFDIDGAEQLYNVLTGGLSSQRYFGIDPMEVISLLEEKPMRLFDLASVLDRGNSQVEQAIRKMIADGKAIKVDREGEVSLPQYFPADPLPTLQDDPSMWIRFAVISDPHFGSNFSQIANLLSFIDIAVNKYKVRWFLVPGDLTAGVKVYRGQHNELYAHGERDQADSLLKTIPEHEGVEWILMGGNHDRAFHKWAGSDVVRTITDARDDFHYAGYDQAEVPLLEKDGKTVASAILWHPSGGVPYALSYRGQKIAAEITRKELMDVILEEKPSPTVRWIFWGHLHVSDMFPHGPIWVIGPGCFEGTNGYLKAKGLVPIIQGLIVEAKLSERGVIQEQNIRPISFAEQEQSYKCGWVPAMERAVMRQNRLNPLFAYEDD